MQQLLLGFCFLWLGTLSGQIPDPFFPQLGQGIGVNALAAKGDTLYVAGDYQVLGTTNRQHIGAVDITSGAILSWAPQLNGPVRGMYLQGDLLCVWGSFTLVNGQPRNNFALLNAHTGQVEAFQPNIQFPGIPGLQTGTIADAALAGDTLFLAGYFLSVNGQPRANLAALRLDGTLLPWNPATNIPVDRILVTSDKVYVAGPFSQPREGLLAFHRHSGALLPWNPGPNNPGNTFGPLHAVSGSTDVWVSGRFSQLGPQNRPFLGRVDGNSGQPSAFNPGISYSSPVQLTVHTLSEHEGLLYVGGDFATSFQGQFRQHLAVLNPLSGAPDSWQPAPNGRVMALLHHRDALFVGGQFSQISGQTHRFLAAYNTAVPTQVLPEPEPVRMRLAPNPAQDAVWLDLSTAVSGLWLADVAGRVLRHWPAQEAGIISLDLSRVPAGSYRLIWQSESMRGHRALQVMR